MSSAEYNILEYGAVPGGNKINTKAVQAAVDTCAENGGGREDANKAKQAAPSRRTLGYGERLYTRPLKKATMKSGPAARVALNRRAYPRRPSYPAVRFANAALVLRTDRAKTTSAFCPARCPAYPHIPPRAHRCSPSGRLCKMSNIF